MQNPKRLFLIAGDLVALYAALFLTIWIRYGEEFNVRLFEHLFPMSVIFAIWTLVFSIAGLYDLARLRNNIEFIKTLWLTLAINAVLAALLFYLIPSLFGITPRRNLFVFLVIFLFTETVWRRAANRALAAQHPAHIVILGGEESAGELTRFIRENPPLGYRTTTWSAENALALFSGRRSSIRQFVADQHIDFFVVPLHMKDSPPLKEMISALLAAGVRMIDLVQFYEATIRKLPVRAVDELWLMEHMGDQHRFYDNLKRAAEFLFALTLQVLLAPLELLIACAVKVSSAGPAIYRQVRIGRHGEPFTLYKFRTMRADAEKNGPQWAEPYDRRTTPVGKLLRISHLDELPQLVNILKGELSFVGPRPERPEIIKDLRAQVPFYDLRQLIKPGVTGWAQINYPSDKTIDDVKEKLQYDLYYLNNRSFVLDLAIVIRTIKTIFKTPQ